MHFVIFPALARSWHTTTQNRYLKNKQKHTTFFHFPSCLAFPPLRCVIAGRFKILFTMETSRCNYFGTWDHTLWKVSEFTGTIVVQLLFHYFVNFHEEVQARSVTMVSYLCSLPNRTRLLGKEKRRLWRQVAMSWNIEDCLCWKPVPVAKCIVISARSTGCCLNLVHFSWLLTWVVCQTNSRTRFCVKWVAFFF